VERQDQASSWEDFPWSWACKAGMGQERRGMKGARLEENIEQDVSGID
jgi:hypothetical protein